MVVGSSDAHVYAWHGDGSAADGWPQAVGMATYGSPVIADLDGNGDVEVVVGSYDQKVYAWTCEAQTDDPLPWPQFHHDAQRTGRFGPLAPVVPNRGRIAGQVRISGTSTPLAGATVEVRAGGVLQATVRIGALGTYTFPALAPGTYAVTASKLGYASDAMPDVVVSAGDATTVNFDLVGIGLIAGQARAQGGVNLSGATVAASLASVVVASATTDSRGIYLMEPATPSTEYVVTVTKVGYYPQTKHHVVLTLGVPTYVNFMNLVKAEGPLLGQVRDLFTKEPLPGARVTVYRSDNHDYVAAATAKVGDGIYVVNPLAPGTYTVTATMDGYMPQSRRNITVTADGGVFCNFDLEPATVLKGQVRSAAGVPLDGATIDILKDGVVWQSCATQAPLGIYQISMYMYQGLPDEPVAVGASMPGYVRQYKSGITITPGDTTYANFDLQPSGRLQGQVLDADTGQPILFASVRAYKDGVQWATAITTPPYGTYEIDSDLPAGTYVLFASAPGYSRQGRAGIGIAAGATTHANFSLPPE